MAMREYGDSSSSPIRTISFPGTCLRSASAATTPAGPLPTITKATRYSPQTKAPRRPRYGPLGAILDSLQAEPRERFLGRHAFVVPAARLVILRPHFVDAVDLALGRAGLGRFGLQARRQVVVLGGKAGRVVEQALHVPDALAHCRQFFHRPPAFAGGIELRLQIGQRPGEGGEYAHPGRIEYRGC